MIKVTYYYSACVAITTPDVSILCDPWFTDGIYDGAWYQYPKVENPIELIGKHDIIYVSHIHPDHYDPRFLKEYLKVYPDTKILICEGVYLDKKMDADGVPYSLCESDHAYQFGDTNEGATYINIYINNNGSISDIDTALVVSKQGQHVVNMNDNQYNQEQIDKITHLRSIDIALIGHTGAGPYPQTYYRDTAILEEKAEEKKQEFFKRYTKMADALDAKVNIPFAGQYLLGGRLAHLNKYRGVSDAVEVLPFDNNALVLEQGASIDTKTFIPTGERVKTFDIKEMEAYASSLTEPMDYMKDFKYLSADKMPWDRLLPKAYHNAMDKLEYKGDNYHIIIKFPGEKYFYMKLGGVQRDCYTINEVIAGMNCSLIEIDYRYLFGLLTGVYHWNNAEVGSQYMTTRVPDVYNRSVQRFLNFFTV